MSTTGGPGCLLEGLRPFCYNPPIEAVVLAFGVNEDSQLGLDGYADVLSPKVVEALLGTRLRGREFACSPIIAGSRNTMAITADGEILAWGWNARATLGMGHRDPVPKPRRIPGLRGVKIVQVALGGWHALALDEDGQVWGWGGTEYCQACTSETEQREGRRDVVTPAPCLPGIRVKQVAAGGMSSLALTEDGHLWAWGEPWGDFGLVIDRRPKRIDTTGNFVRIACGAFHSLAVTDKGELYSWGLNDFGACGNGTTAPATTPQRVVEGLEGVVVADVAAGGWHSIALATDGSVYVFGRGEYGRLGVGKGSSLLRPTKLEALSGMRVVEAAAGGTHSIFVTEDGRAWITGRGSYGRLGSGTEEEAYAPIEVKLPGGPERWRVISAAAGGRSSFLLALPDNGDLHAREAEWLARRLSSSPLSSSGIAAVTGIGGGGGGAGLPPHPPPPQPWGVVVPGGEADDEAEDEDADDNASIGGSSTEAQRQLLSGVEGAIAGFSGAVGGNSAAQVVSEIQQERNELEAVEVGEEGVYNELRAQEAEEAAAAAQLPALDDDEDEQDEEGDVYDEEMDEDAEELSAMAASLTHAIGLRDDAPGDG